MAERHRLDLRHAHVVDEGRALDLVANPRQKQQQKDAAKYREPSYGCSAAMEDLRHLACDPFAPWRAGRAHYAGPASAASRDLCARHAQGGRCTTTDTQSRRNSQAKQPIITAALAGAFVIRESYRQNQGG